MIEVQQLYQCALARSALAHDAQYFAGIEIEIDICDGHNGAALRANVTSNIRAGTRDGVFHRLPVYLRQPANAQRPCLSVWVDHGQAVFVKRRCVGRSPARSLARKLLSLTTCLRRPSISKISSINARSSPLTLHRIPRNSSTLNLTSSNSS